MLTVSLILFGIFLASLFVIALLVVFGVWSESRKSTLRYGQHSWGALLSVIAIYATIGIANIGWWGGWITLAIWAVQTLAG
jgi:hypothetical protein